jgi:hypothetical protein
MQGLFVTGELSDLSLLTLQLVLFVLREVIVYKVEQHNHSVLLVGLVSSKVPMTLQLV